MKKILCLIEGQDKEVLSSLLAEKHQQVVDSQRIISPVNFFKIPEGHTVPVIDPQKWAEAHTWCKVCVKGDMKKGVQSIIIPYDWNKFQKEYYLKIAQSFGYEVHEVFSRVRNEQIETPMEGNVV